jgi:glyceraldehyde 3-phosphate dehydrogenase (phosphorylating)
MAVRVAINGFGRIGRNIFRAIHEAKRNDLEVVAINDLGDVAINANLLKRDSVHGPYPGTVETKGDRMVVDGKPVLVSAERDPAKLPWKANGIDIALECTGIFTSGRKAKAHIEAGAKKVLISAPASEVDLTVVYGVNHKSLKASHVIVSNASCTTNCLAPLAMLLHKEIGILRGYMTTVHAYTGDQPVLDTLHKDPRRARAAALSMIPTTTGAAKAVALVLPELKGKLDGSAIRVPTPNVSLVDLAFDAGRDTSVEEIHGLVKKYAASELKGVLAWTDEPVVSVDMNHNPASSTFDFSGTQVIEKRFVRVLSWYDNEWGFSNRMADVALAMANAK